jgi:hypothetical protein
MKPAETSLPPRLPRDERELHRTITLLGSRKQTELNSRARSELESLIGVYPSAKEAALWKQVLRRAMQEQFKTTSEVP